MFVHCTASDRRGVSERMVNRIILSLLLLMGTLSGCEERSHKAEAPPPHVHVALPEERSVTLWQESTGTTQAIQTAAIVARVEGTLQRVLFQAGDAVQKGDVLFVLEPDMFQAKLEASRAQLAVQEAARNQARIEYRRNVDLYREKAAAQTDVVRWREQLASSEAQVRLAQANVRQASIELGYATIRAPFTGRISRTALDVGNVISPQSGTLATLVAIDPVYVNFSVNPELLPVLRSGTKDLELAVGDGAFSIGGKLEYIAPEIDSASGTLAVRGIFPNPERRLLPGQFVRVRMAGGELRNVLSVPRQAMNEAQGGMYLLVLDAENRVVRKAVEVGPVLNEPEGVRQAVLKGITLHDRVIVEGMEHVRPGQIAVVDG